MASKEEPLIFKRRDPSSVHCQGRSRSARLSARSRGRWFFPTAERFGSQPFLGVPAGGCFFFWGGWVTCFQLSGGIGGGGILHLSEGLDIGMSFSIGIRTSPLLGKQKETLGMGESSYFANPPPALLQGPGTLWALILIPRYLVN